MCHRGTGLSCFLVCDELNRGGRGRLRLPHWAVPAFRGKQTEQPWESQSRLRAWRRGAVRLRLQRAFPHTVGRKAGRRKHLSCAGFGAQVSGWLHGDDLPCARCPPVSRRSPVPAAHGRRVGRVALQGPELWAPVDATAEWSFPLFHTPAAACDGSGRGAVTPRPHLRRGAVKVRPCRAVRSTQ